jgi:hypothetical protein
MDENQSDRLDDRTGQASRKKRLAIRYVLAEPPLFLECRKRSPTAPGQ